MFKVYCKDLIINDPNWDLNQVGNYKWNYYWTINLKVGYNFYWLPVAYPFKSNSMLFMKSLGGMLSITNDSSSDSYPDVIWPSTPIKSANNENNSTENWRFEIAALTNSLTTKSYTFTHSYYWNGFYNCSITDLNSYQIKQKELTILPGI